MCRGNRKRDVSTMVTYSHASTPLGQSERAHYLSYFIKINCIQFISLRYINIVTIFILALLRSFFFFRKCGLVRDERCQGAYWIISTESVVTEMTVIKESKNSYLSIIPRSICISLSLSLATLKKSYSA